MIVWIAGGGTIGKAVADRLQKEHMEDMLSDRLVVTGHDEIALGKPHEINEWWRVGGGTPTHVVYTAGVNRLAWIGDIDPVDLFEMFESNLYGFIYVLQWLVERERMGAGPASVVAVSSDAAVRPMRTSLPYCASKAALNAAVRCAARELGPHGWRVNAVAPGVVEGTGMTKSVDEQVPRLRGWTADYARQYERQQGVVDAGRRATPDEVARVVIDVLLGPAYLNGEIITVNGGR